MAHENINLPYDVAGYQYLTFEGKKFSKSKQVGVFCYSLMNSDIDVDTLRSYLVQILPEKKEADFKWEEYKVLINSELIGKFGNFFNRTLNMINSYFGGEINLKSLSLNDADSAFVNECADKIRLITALMEKIELREAYREIISIATAANKYLDTSAPWKLIKSNRGETEKILYLALNVAKALAILSFPFTPKSMLKIWKEQLSIADELDQKGAWSMLDTVLSLPLQHKVSKPSPLYKIIEDSDLERYRNIGTADYDLASLIK